MTSEFHKPLHSLTIDAIDHTSIQGEPVPQTNLPFRQCPLPFFSQVSVNSEEFSDAETDNIVKVSRVHGRSSLLRTGETPQLFFSDEYGNIFSALTSKGNNFENVRVLNREGSRFSINGLEGSSSMVRILKASSVMRRDGIDTDLVVRVKEPETVPFGGGMISLSEMKKRLFEHALENYSRENSQFGDEDISRLARFFANNTFFITTRGTQVAERLADPHKTRDELRQSVRATFRYVNFVNAIGGNPERFDIEKDEDLERYFTDYFPKKVAQNMARLHNLGLVHTSFFDHNVNLAGAIVDLDAVVGPVLGLGDSENTMQDFIDDAVEALTVIATGNILDPNHLKKSISNFISSYIVERGFEDNLFDHIREIFSLLHATQLEGQTELWEKYSTDVLNNLGLRFDFMGSRDSALRSLNESPEWNMERIVGGTIKATTSELPEDLPAIFVDPVIERIKNRPLAEFLEDAFLEFQLMKSLAFIDDALGDKLRRVEAKFGDMAMQSIRFMLSETKANELYAKLKPEDWIMIERVLFDRWFSSHFQTADLETKAQAGKIFFEEENVLVLVQDAEPVFCVNSVPLERFASAASQFNPDDPIDAITWVNDEILGRLKTRGKKRPIIAFTDGILTDFDTKYEPETVNGPVLAGFGKIYSGQNIIEGASYLGTIDLDERSGKFVATLKTTMTEDQVLSRLPQNTKNIVFSS